MERPAWSRRTFKHLILFHQSPFPYLPGNLGPSIGELDIFSVRRESTRQPQLSPTRTGGVGPLSLPQRRRCSQGRILFSDSDSSKSDLLSTVFPARGLFSSCSVPIAKCRSTRKPSTPSQMQTSSLLPVEEVLFIVGMALYRALSHWQQQQGNEF